MAMPSMGLPERSADTQLLYDVHSAAVDYYRAQLVRNLGPCNYLWARGLGFVVDREAPWRVGFAPGTWTGLTEHLRGRGFRGSDLIAAGLAIRGHDGRIFDMFRDRIVFPIRNRGGDTVAFIGRVWHPHGGTGLHVPKYLNSPDTLIYTKGQQLFGLYEQRDRVAAGWPPVLVEGPADTLAVWLSYSRAGRTGLVSLAPCGTALTDAQLRTAVGLSGARRFGLGVAFDGDQAGRRAADHAYDLLAAYPGIVARGAVFDPGADPADLVRSAAGRAQLRATLERRAQPLLHLVIDHRLERMLERSPRLLHEIPGRLGLARALAPLIAEQRPEVAAAAIGHVARVVQRLIAGQINGPTDVSETLRNLTLAVADYLEATQPFPR
jgi:DNA primase